MRILKEHELSWLSSGPIPQHVALVMDGNRRWAAARGVGLNAAYRMVPRGIVTCLESARSLGVRSVSFFALSPNNLKRSQEETRILTDLDSWLWSKELIDYLDDDDIGVEVIGEPSSQIPNQFPGWLREDSPARRIGVRIAVNYSASSGTVDRTADIPPVDLFVRTAGEERLSDFLLVESAFAELVFTDTLWPDFTGLHLASAINAYQTRERRFGR